MLHSYSKNITGYVFDIRGNPIYGTLIFKQNNASFTFPVNPVNGRVNVNLPEIDGRFYAQNISSVKLYKNYPNPFNDLTSFEIASPKKSSGTFNLYNVLGQKVFSQHVFFENGITRFEISGPLAAGLYFLELLTAEGKDVIKMIDIDGKFIDHNNISLMQKAFSHIDIRSSEHQTLLEYREKNNPVFSVKVEGETSAGYTVLPFQSMRYFNQSPRNDNIATASVVDDTLTAMLVDVMQLKNDFIVYVLDDGIAIDTLFYLSAPMFRSSWQDIHIDQNTIELFGDENMAVSNPQIFDRQNRLIKMLTNALIINTQLGADTLLTITHDTTSTPDWLEQGHRVWSINNQFNPDHGSFLRFIDGSWRLLFGEAQVRENDGWEVMINQYLSNASTLFNRLVDQDLNITELSELISTKSGAERMLDQRGINYLRCGLLFKGKTIRIYK